jgi:hypothetical protein
MGDRQTDVAEQGSRRAAGRRRGMVWASSDLAAIGGDLAVVAEWLRRL